MIMLPRLQPRRRICVEKFAGRAWHTKEAAKDTVEQCYAVAHFDNRVVRRAQLMGGGPGRETNVRMDGHSQHGRKGPRNRGLEHRYPERSGRVLGKSLLLTYLCSC